MQRFCRYPCGPLISKLCTFQTRVRQGHLVSLPNKYDLSNMATLYFGVATSIAFLPKLSFADINARMQSMYLSKIEETSSTNSSFVSVTMKSHTSSAMLAMLVESSIKGENFFSTNVINFNPFDRRLLILVSRPNKK